LAHRLARGGDISVPAPRRPEQDVTVRTDLDPPAARSDVAAFAARALAEELAERLQRRGVVCGRVQVLARTEDGTELSRTWRLDAAPSAADLTDRVRWQLDGWLAGRSARPPSAPLVHLELLAQEVSPAGVVSDGLWGRRGRGEVQAERAALRVQGLLGAEGVLVPVLQGGRDPRTRVRLVAWGDDPVPALRPDAPWPGQLPSPPPATVLGERRAVVVLDDAGAPVTVDARARLSGEPVRVVDEDASWEVVGWAGPWPMWERWWERGRRRNWLQVALSDGVARLLALEAGTWRRGGGYDGCGAARAPTGVGSARTGREGQGRGPQRARVAPQRPHHHVDVGVERQHGAGHRLPHRAGEQLTGPAERAGEQDRLRVERVAQPGRDLPGGLPGLAQRPPARRVTGRRPL